jgi:hypothetical protein
MPVETRAVSLNNKTETLVQIGFQQIENVVVGL